MDDATLFNDLRERAMARVAAGETIRVVAAHCGSAPRAFQNVGTPARDRSVSAGQIAPQAAVFCRASADWLRAGCRPLLYAAGTGAELAERG